MKISERIVATLVSVVVLVGLVALAGAPGSEGPAGADGADAGEPGPAPREIACRVWQVSAAAADVDHVVAQVSAEAHAADDNFGDGGRIDRTEYFLDGLDEHRINAALGAVTTGLQTATTTPGLDETTFRLLSQVLRTAARLRAVLGRDGYFDLDDFLATVLVSYQKAVPRAAERCGSA